MIKGGGERTMSCAQVMYQPYATYLSYDRAAAAAAAHAAASAANGESPDKVIITRKFPRPLVNLLLGLISDQVRLL